MSVDEAILTLGQTAIIAILGLAGAVIWRRSFHPGWFLAALGLYLLYGFLLTRGFFLLENLPAGARWNWFGKAMSLAAMLIVAALPGFGYRASGLTLRQKPGSGPAYLVFAGLAALFAYLAIADGAGRSDWETIAFQWTMPGFDEEVFYRGVLLLAMNEAFRHRLPVFGAPIGWGGLLTCVLFGLAHGLSYGAEGFAFDAMTFLVTGGPSLILLWMRERTGSVLLPILAHNAANGIGTLF